MLYKLFSLVVFLTACSVSVSDESGKVSNRLNHSGKYPVLEMANGKKYHTGLLERDNLKNLSAPHVRFNDCSNLPDAFDLRPLGVVPPIKDQGQCGSCWAFSKTGSLESALLGQKKTMTLSVQELVSNDKNQFGCGGGYLDDFKYQIQHGQGLAKDFPYVAADVSSKKIPVAAQGVSFQYVGSANQGPTENELKCALVKYKTVPWITVGATSYWGSPPASEKTPYTNCQRSGVNHAVGVVGYFKDASGKTQFIMKNSWGAGWGDKGYMALALGCDSFGDSAAFIEIAPAPVPPSPEPTPKPVPCSAPKVAQAAEVQFLAGVQAMIGVAEEKDTTYTWSADGKTVGTTAMIYVSPAKDTVYKLSAKNSCAIAESQIRARVVLSLQK